ncbi:MAG: choice-of-anchor D domain-containing protein [Verrucomicrobiales bacterium]
MYHRNPRTEDVLPRTSKNLTLPIALAACLGFASPLLAQSSYTQNFDDIANDETDLGDGTTINTNAPDLVTASVQDGALRITEEGVGSVNSSFFIPSPGDEIVDGFSAVFDIALEAGGTPADGFSFSLGPFGDTDLGAGEEGTVGIAFEFDTYDNGNENGFGNGIGIDISVDGVDIDGGQARVGNGANPLDNEFYKFDGEFRKFEAYWGSDGNGGGRLWVILDGVPIFENLEIPDYTPDSGDAFLFSARTGGATETLLIDNIEINAPGALPVHDPALSVAKTFGFEPTIIGETVTGVLPITNAGSDEPLIIASGVLSGADAGAFALTTAFPLTINPGESANIGITFTAEAPSGGRRATLALDSNDSFPKLQEISIPISGIAVPETLEATIYEQNFDAFANEETDLGDGSSLTSNNGVAMVVDGALQLTRDGTGGSNSGWVIPTLGPSATQSWQATFDLTLAGGGGSPADGFSFSFGPYTEGFTGGEESTSGLGVEFDTWDNEGEGQATGIGMDISVDGADVPDGQMRIDPADNKGNNRFFKFDGVARPVTISYEQTGGDTGRLSYEIDGDVVYDKLEITGLEPGVDWTFAFGARTGGATETVIIDNMRIIAPKPAEYVQSFDGFADGEVELDDGSEILSNGSASVQSNALRLTTDGTTGSVANFRTPSLGVLATDSFSARFDLALAAGGDPADGFSFNFGAIPAGLGGSEEGFGTGLAVEFDTWDNGVDNEEGEFGIGIDVSVGGTTAGKNRIDAASDKKNNALFKFDGEPRQVEIIWKKVDDDTSVVDVTIGGVFVFSKLELTGFAPGPDDIFAFAARTGGATETVTIDNLEISAPAKESVVRDPKIGGERTVAIAAGAGETVDGIVTVANEGASKDLVISAGSLTGANFELLTTFPISIAPGASADIVVRFNSPAQLGSVTGDLTLTSNDSLDTARTTLIRINGISCSSRRVVWSGL